MFNGDVYNHIRAECDYYNLYIFLLYSYSTAILKYICNKYGLADHWYPKDIKRQGKVDEALNWFPQNLRCGAYYLTVSYSWDTVYHS